MDNSTAFDAAHPPQKITNPGASATFQAHPRHLYHADGEYCTAIDEADEATKRAEGWFLTQKDAQAAQAAAVAADEAPPEKPAKPAKPKAVA